MIRFSLLILFMLLQLLSLFGQQDSLISDLSNLSAAIVKVETGKATFHQEFSFDPAEIYKVSLSLREEGKKESDRLQYEFNLVDLSDGISWRPKGDVIEFKLSTRKRQKFIRIMKNDQQENYSNEVVFYANSSDNARQIEAYFRSSRIQAQSVFKSEVEIGDCGTGILWLSEHTTSFAINRSDYRQNLIKLSGERPVIAYSLSRKNLDQRFLVNLADLNPASAKLEIKGQEVMVVTKTLKNLKYVGVETNGERDNYVNRLEILVESIDEGRMFLDVLRKTIPHAQSRMKNCMPNIETIEQGGTVLQSLLKPIETKKGLLIQKLSGACNAELVKSASTEAKDRFFVDQFDNMKVAIEVAGNVLIIKSPIYKKEPWIQQYADGVLKGYTSKTLWQLPDMESARDFQHTLRQMISLCHEQFQQNLVRFTHGQDAVQWLVKTVNDLPRSINGYAQEMKQLNGDYCQLSLTHTTRDTKRSHTDVFEFDLADLDPGKINPTVKRRELAIELETRGNKEYIKYFEDSKVENYTSKTKIYLDDLTLTRTMTEAWKAATESCQK